MFHVLAHALGQTSCANLQQSPAYMPRNINLSTKWLLAAWKITGKYVNTKMLPTPNTIGVSFMVIGSWHVYFRVTYLLPNLAKSILNLMLHAGAYLKQEGGFILMFSKQQSACTQKLQSTSSSFHHTHGVCKKVRALQRSYMQSPAREFPAGVQEKFPQVSCKCGGPRIPLPVSKGGLGGPKNWKT